MSDKPDMAERGTALFEAHDLASYSLFACEPPPVLYHYTDVAGAHGVICSKSIWLTPLRLLNDQSELGLAIELFKQAAEHACKESCSADEGALLSRVAGQLDSFSRSNVCIAAFSESGDLLSQWRAYGDRGSGVALGFIGAIGARLGSTGEFHLWRCIYSESDQRKIVQELIEKLLDLYRRRKRLPADELISSFNTTFLRVAPVLKNAHFAEEKEWRIISADTPYTSPGYNVRLRGGQLVEHYELAFARFSTASDKTLDHIVIGPTADPNRVSAPLRVLLHKNGFDDCGITSSEIPFRSYG